MFGLFRKLTGQSEGGLSKKVNFLVLGKGEPPPHNRWYRMADWYSPNFLRRRVSYSKDWKMHASDQPVVGIADPEGVIAFVRVCDADDFQTPVVRPPQGIQVHARGTVDGHQHSGLVGYLQPQLAAELDGEQEIACEAYGCFLPMSKQHPFGLQVHVLVRSAAYLKRAKSL